MGIKKEFEPEEIEDIIKDTKMLRAFAYFRLNKFSEGARDLDDVLNSSHSDVDLGLLEEKDYNNYISKYPKDYRGYLFRGIYFNRTLSWSDKKYKDLALQDFKKAVSLKSDLAIGYYYLAHFYWIEKKDTNLALQTINKAVKLKSTPKVASLVFNLKAGMHSDLGQYDEALKSYTKAINSFPEYADNYFDRGFFFDRNKKYREAINDYTSAINAKIRIMFGAKGMEAVSLGLLNRADAYQKIGDYNKAVDDYSRIIETKLEYFEGHSLNPYEFLTMHFAGRGKAFFNLGEYKSAIDDFTKVIEVNFDSSVTEYEYRGKSYSRLQKHKEAIDDFDKAIEWWKKNYKGPTLEGIYSERGLSYLQIGDFKNALSDLDLAIQIDPEDFVAYSNRGITYLNIGNNEQAVKDFNHALKLSPQNPTIYTLRGNAFYNLGRLTDAIKDYTTAITLNPSTDSAYYGRGMAYVAQKNNQQAMNDMLVSARLGNPSAQDYLTKLGITW